MDNLRHIIKEMLEQTQVSAQSQQVSGLGKASTTHAKVTADSQKVQGLPTGDLPPRKGPLMCLHNYSLDMLGKVNRGSYTSVGGSHSKVYTSFPQSWKGTEVAYQDGPLTETGEAAEFRIQFTANPLPADYFEFMTGIRVLVGGESAQPTKGIFFWGGKYKCAGGTKSLQGHGEVEFLGGETSKLIYYFGTEMTGAPKAINFNAKQALFSVTEIKKVYDSCSAVLKGKMTLKELQEAVKTIKIA